MSEDTAVKQKGDFKSKRNIILIILIAIIIVFVGILNYFTSKNLYNGKIGQNIYIEDVNVSNMTKQEIIDAIPDNWKYAEHNGFVHIKDEAGKIRIRIDPPDKVTQYPRIHVYDNDGNLLDSLGNIVDRKSPDGHIPYKN